MTGSVGEMGKRAYYISQPMHIHAIPIQEQKERNGKGGRAERIEVGRWNNSSV